MRIQTLSKEEVLRELHTTEQGLTEKEARKRLLDFGENEIAERKKVPWLFRFASHLVDLFAILLWIAGGLAFLVSRLADDVGMAYIGLALVTVIFINAFFTFLQEYRAEKASEALKKLMPYQASVIREGKEIHIPARQIVPGDIITVRAGDRVSADARIIKVADLAVDISHLTGESEPQVRKDVPKKEYEEPTNLIYSGSTVVRGNGIAAVFATGMATEFGKIAHLTQEIEEAPTPIQRELTYVARTITFIAVGLSFIFFTAGELIGIGTQANILFAIGIIVANVPEGLLPTVTLSLSLASQRMASRNALVKRLSSVETLGGATVICTDKTGTITENKMTMDYIYTPYESKSKKLSDAGPSELLLAAILCNNAKIEDNKVIGEPTEAALLQGASTIMADVRSEWERVDEIAFTSERKMMSTVNRKENMLVLYSKGAPVVILPKCTRIATEKGIQNITDEDRERIVEHVSDYAGRGMRVIAFAKKSIEGEYTRETLEENMVFLGIGALRDPPRKEVPYAVEKCKRAGIKVIVITGDDPLTAKTIAREVGIAKEPVTITGSQLDMMRKRELEEVLHGEVLFARTTPGHKLRIVRALKEMGSIVAVTGDGVNDAPALKEADIGVAMGKTGTDVARESADMILMDDNFATIVLAVEEGRAMFDNIRRFIAYIFTHLVPQIVSYILFVLLRIPLPLTVIQILAIDLGTEMAPSIALGAERPEPDVMNRPPRRRGERILTVPILLRSYLFLGLIEAIAAMSAYYYVLTGGGWSYGMPLSDADPLYLKATTITLAAIVITQVANSLTSRTTKESVFKIGIFTNKYLIIGIAIELILLFLIVYTEPLQRITGTAPLELNEWLILVPFAVLLLFADELRKWLVRKS
ncbi:P-type ATPase, translocating [Candidatus Methanoperedens nitroreducens]|uniref:P-type ATPase, translocating n=1 Tax=Candidatus Methanoperedens nitratireducens TaxID=1392998 RepID=A0A062V8M2_9EURY|nr:cation-transporting P-type ATPase [Candidatus Methanoperedens nitroreducens]KCZ71720.1 P-type ATPase, translocating [Candidatus Methanoperedens nitroreducens]MDJ1422307.1 cation-transporting P-type ATPase [Candidatus Methanoperedens sp.]